MVHDDEEKEKKKGGNDHMKYCTFKSCIILNLSLTVLLGTGGFGMRDPERLVWASLGESPNIPSLM